MRDRFNEQLERLNVALIEMGALCEEAISSAAKAIGEPDEQLLEQAARCEREIDHSERDIESLCMKLLLQQQPVARDLLSISAALRMIADMERIGDQAADIAEIVRDMGESDLRRVGVLQSMACCVIGMVTDSVESFVRRDLGLARQVMKADDQVDGLFLQVRGELIERIGQGQRPEVCLDLLMIAKYLERIGDHAVNIAEWVEYSLTGHHEGEQ